MSGSHQPEKPQVGNEKDPSMEDILASIRRILSEEERQPTDAPPMAPASESDVLVLNSAMMVPNPDRTVDAPAPEESAMPDAAPPAPDLPPEDDPAASATAGLVAPQAAAAAAAAVGGLIRQLAAERALQVHSGGPTIEDLVRQEMRPLLKEWLDLNLPQLVERLVRAEIERVVGRAIP